MVKASAIYNKQNQTLHKGFKILSMPYHEHKDVWVSLMRDMCKRKNIESLTNLTLFERRMLINHIRKQGAKVFNPAVPRVLGHWRKGDPEAVYEKAVEKGYPGRPKNMDDPNRKALLSKIEAHLADAGKQWSYADSMARHMFKVDKIGWCDEGQLYKVVQALEVHAKRHGRQYNV